jgi:hypothetical protein
MNFRELIIQSFQDETIRKDIKDITRPLMEWIYNEVHIYLVIICVYCILIFIILIIILRYMYIMSHIPLHLEQMNNIII